jgi:IstB-like ATP binding protein
LSKQSSNSSPLKMALETCRWCVLNKVLVTELARCEFIDMRENVLLVGSPGTGRSNLATALAAAACQKGYKVRFFRATELVTTLIEARDERSFLRFKGSRAKLGLWCSTSSATCPRPRWAPSCCST